MLFFWGFFHPRSTESFYFSLKTYIVVLIRSGSPCGYITLRVHNSPSCFYVLMSTYNMLLFLLLVQRLVVIESTIRVRGETIHWNRIVSLYFFWQYTYRIMVQVTRYLTIRWWEFLNLFFKSIKTFKLWLMHENSIVIHIVRQVSRQVSYCEVTVA